MLSELAKSIKLQLCLNPQPLEISLFICTFLVGSLYFAGDAKTTLVLSAAFLTIMGMCASTIISITVVVFPTQMRCV